MNSSRWALCALFVILSIALMEAADFDFIITARFKNAKPSDPRYPYFDYCGFDCSRSDPNIKMVNSYCDTACRQFNNVWGPFCYTNQKCPSNFNSLFTSAIQLRWGAPAGESGQSGMGFTPVNNGQGSFNVQQEFKLGDLTHYNFPISANTAVPKFEFEFSLTIKRGGITYLNGHNLLFPMNCDETPNNLVPRPCPNPTCPYPSRLGCNNGIPGCPDQITFQTQINGDLSFELSDKSRYTLAITGFRLPGTTTTVKDFISDEKMYTTASIYAVVTRACPDCSKANTVPVFNQGTFTCECVCPTERCPAPLTRLPDCTCGCPQDVCGLGASAVVKDGKCTCECTEKDGEKSPCAAPKRRGVCPNDNSKCCCVCPDTKCPAPAKPSENTADCACTGCPTCAPKGKNWVASADNCACFCPLTDKNCRADLEVFNKTACQCDCKFPTCKDDFVSDNCNCACSKSKLDAKCQALNRATLFKEFDPKNPDAGQCTCGPCVGNFKNNTATGLCECTLECPKDAFFVVDPVSCTCKCPPGGPPNCPKPQIPNPVTCKCDPCDVTKEQCDCPPARKANCERLKRQYIFNSTFCGCTDCIGQFIDTDPKKEAECTNCPLTDEICKKNDPNSLKVLNATACDCICPVNAKCPNPRDIYIAETCSCRPCLPGECVCGNGFVEAGELCDYGENATECCKDCQLLDDIPCLKNKCGKCQRNGKESTCVDQSANLCKSGECFNSTCATKDNIQICEIKNFDGSCGDGDLCARRCLDGKCQDYDLSFVSSRCATPPSECGACCTYACNKATGNCTVAWDQLNKGCTDGLLCTINDTCVATDNSTAPLKCEGKVKCTEQNLGKTFGTPCTVWDCSEGRFGACIEIPVNDTVSCPSSGFCSLTGNCSVNGECIQPRRTCSSPDPCQVGRCREDLDKCEFVTDLANGLPCDDGDNCTSGDVCVEGACKGNDACNSTTPGPTVPLIPLIVTAAVVAAAALVAGFFIYQAINGANIMDPATWGEINSSNFDANPLYQEATKFGDNPLYQS